MRSSTEALCIVIAESRETADGLHEYLTKSGFAARTSRRLHDASTLCANASALVLFPDEFDEREVLASLRSLHAKHPRLLLLLVTAAPQRVRAACGPDPHASRTVVLAKPTFGWNLLDAIRTHVTRAR
ncbi:MAG TPA: hypothetical protein VJV78_39985 [Polyangiales bacterium]|nr:hypothetical protein [Polyangiales bacterium]